MEYSRSTPLSELRRSLFSRQNRLTERDGCRHVACRPPQFHRPDTFAAHTSGVAGELIVSVSGINNRTLADFDEFRRQLDSRGVPLSLFVAPRLKHHYRLDKDPDTVDWLTRQRDAGDSIVLHGFDQAATKRRRDEFATMAAHEANLRLLAADRILEHTGLRTRLFAAPRWKVSKGTTKALPRNGFRLLIGTHGITDMVADTTSESRLVGIGAGFVAEPWWCKVLVHSTERTARRGGTVRLAVAAGKLALTGPRQAILDGIDLALMHGCVPAIYRWGANPAAQTHTAEGNPAA